jgi:hypothetical protein
MPFEWKRSERSEKLDLFGLRVGGLENICKEEK